MAERDGDLVQQRAFWDRVARTKTFAHPLREDLLRRWIPPSANILDMGCGYGRLCARLRESGYPHVTGVDPSGEMIRRGLKEFPGLDLRQVEGTTLPLEAGTFDAALLFTVLTSIPLDRDQRGLLEELRRILRPGGILYVSDLLLQSDKRNLERYARFRERFGCYGVFELPEGGVMRHHDPRWIREDLLAGLEILDWSEPEVRTMNGNPARAFQAICRMPP